MAGGAGIVMDTTDNGGDRSRVMAVGTAGGCGNIVAGNMVVKLACTMTGDAVSVNKGHAGSQAVKETVGAAMTGNTLVMSGCIDQGIGMTVGAYGAGIVDQNRVVRSDRGMDILPWVGMT